MKGKNILLVEDNVSDIELTRRAFEKSHISNELTVVEDGKDAIDYLFCSGNYSNRDSKDSPSVVLLDLNLPRLNGLEVLQAIRENPQTRCLPVVILTSSDHEKDIISSYNLGTNSYIQKPVDFNHFIEAVGKLGIYWLLLNEIPPQK
jgi:two-component system, response regulator